MTYIDQTQPGPEPKRAFDLAVRTNPRGTRIAYHEGPSLHNVTRTAAGKAAQQAYEAGKVMLCQKKVADYRYLYLAVVL